MTDLPSPDKAALDQRGLEAAVKALDSMRVDYLSDAVVEHAAAAAIRAYLAATLPPQPVSAGEAVALRWRWVGKIGWNLHDELPEPYDAPIEVQPLYPHPVHTREDEWQPISTAPKDGTEFLAYGSYLYPDDDDITYYRKVAWATGDENWPLETDEGKFIVSAFSHWLPLPPLPAPPARALIPEPTK